MSDAKRIKLLASHELRSLLEKVIESREDFYVVALAASTLSELYRNRLPREKWRLTRPLITAYSLCLYVLFDKAREAASKGDERKYHWYLTLVENLIKRAEEIPERVGEENIRKETEDLEKLLIKVES